jgi:N-acetylglucosamine-6-phosphate deacetylase
MGSSGWPGEERRVTAGRLRIRDVSLAGREGDGRFDIDIVDGLVASVEPAGSSTTPDPPVVVDGSGLLAAPGFIDLQVNGAAGFDLTADPSSIWAVGAALPRFGVSSFLPTIVTTTRENVEAARATLNAGPPPGYSGARALGLHVEGPFLAPTRHGAHDPSLLLGPDAAFVDGWSPEEGVRLVTLAPELPGAIGLIELLVSRGVVVAIGHTDASAEEARAGFDAGATAVTHLFNAMPGLDHRRPGPVGFALEDQRVTIGLIADGVHVDPLAVAVAWRATGPSRLAVVTDAIAALGMAPGRYHLGSMDVTVDATGGRLDDGRLAGGVLGLDGAIRNLAAFTGASSADALATVTSTPARLLGLGDSHGVMRPGGVGDVTLLGSDFEVTATIVGGELAYQASGAL